MSLSRSTAALLVLNGMIAIAAAGVAWLPAHLERRLKHIESPDLPIVLPPDVLIAQNPSVDALKQSPIFYRSRELLVIEDPAQILASRPNYVLTGAMLLPNGRSIAYLKGSGSGTDTLRVREGQDLQGWKVKRIELHRVVLAHKDLTAELLPIPKNASPGLIRFRTVASASLSTGSRILGATGVRRADASAQITQREPRLYQPPPPRP